MSRTPKVKFFPEKRRDKTTGKIIETAVPIRFSLAAGITVKSTTGIILDAKYWDPDKKRVKASHTHSAKINKQLSDLKKELEDLCYGAWDKDIRITSDYILTSLKKNQRSDTGFFDRFDEFIEAGKKKWQPSTVKKFTTIKNHLKEFGEKKKVSIGFDQMNEKFFEKFMDYYFEDTNEKEGEKKGYINSYVRKNIKFIRHFLTWATEKGYNKNMDFIKWKLETGQKRDKSTDNVVSLTIAEFLTIYKKSFDTEALQRTRDFLILACSTGLRFSDIANLKKSDIDYNLGVINCTTIKTGVRTQIPFNEFSRSVLTKYQFTPNYNSKGVEMAFPAVTNQKTNVALKELGKAAGLNAMITKVHYQRNKRIDEIHPKHELISTHIGRKTFITLNIWLGVKSEILMGLTTHKSHETMENYYSVDINMKREAMNRFSLENFETLTKGLSTN